jgi:arabinofuranosyltransferase
MSISINRNKQIYFLLLVIAILVMLLPQLYLYSHTSDDAYITYRYATRLANGEGLTFNPGERVEGFSNPLWVLLITGFIKMLPLEAPIIGHLLGLSFSIGTVVVIWRLFINDTDSLSDGIISLIICMAIIFSNPGFHVYATAGLEGPLVMFLVTFGIFLTLQNRKSALILAAVMFGFLGISRPEGLLYAILWYIFAIRLDHTKHFSIKFELWLLSVIFSPSILYECFRIIYYDSLLPNTGLAKPPGVFGSGIIFIIAYFFPWVVSLTPFLLLFLIRVKQTIYFKNALRVCIGPILASLVFVVYAQSDWMPFGRFITPIWPVVAIVLTYWVYPKLNFLKQHLVLKSFQLPYIMAVLTIVLASFFTWKTQIIAYVRNDKLNMLMRGKDQLKVGEWLSRNVKDGTTVATLRLGGISYAAPDLVFWDIYGLTDKEEAIFISNKKPGGFKNDPIWNRSPEIIAAVNVPADWSYTGDEEYLNWLRNHYSFVRSFPQGNYGTFDLWVRNDALNVFSSNN